MNRKLPIGGVPLLIGMAVQVAVFVFDLILFLTSGSTTILAIMLLPVACFIFLAWRWKKSVQFTKDFNTKYVSALEQVYLDRDVSEDIRLGEERAKKNGQVR